MTDQSQKLDQMNCVDTLSATSLPVLAAGQEHCSLQDGQQTDLFGQVHAPASHSLCLAEGGGQEDKRHLWPSWFNLIRECRPSTILGEQVANAITYGWLDEVSNDLEIEDYAIGAAVLPACSVGAPHRRDRLWFVASDNRCERGERIGSQEIQGIDTFSWCKNVRGVEDVRNRSDLPEPLLCSLSDGFPPRLGFNLLHGFGNAIVPQVAAEFIKSCA